MKATTLAPDHATALRGAALALSLPLLVAACGQVAVDDTGGGGGLGGKGGSGAQGGQGGSGAQGGQGGFGAQGGQGGSGGGTAGSGGDGGGGGCEDACVTSADCTLPEPWCAASGSGCNECFGPCTGQECLGANTCASDADCLPPDGKCVCNEDGCTICVKALPGDPPGFPEVLGEGVWLVGWSGGLDHYSWLRFVFEAETTGTFTLFDAEGFTVIPFFDCEGTGLFAADPGTGIVTLEMPAACTPTTLYLDFESFYDPAGFPPHATLAASITTLDGPLAGFQHPVDFCDAAFTACGDPFEP